MMFSYLQNDELSRKPGQLYSQGQHAPLFLVVGNQRFGGERSVYEERTNEHPELCASTVDARPESNPSRTIVSFSPSSLKERIRFEHDIGQPICLRT